MESKGVGDKERGVGERGRERDHTERTGKGGRKRECGGGGGRI